MIVDGLGRAYVGDLGFDLPPPTDRGAVGRIILVMPEGAKRVVADGLAISQRHRGLVRQPPAGRRRDGWRVPR